MARQRSEARRPARSRPVPRAATGARAHSPRTATPSRTTASRASGAARRLRPVPTAALAISLAGLGVSTYLTVAHFTSSAILACSDSGLVNCAHVTTSPQSMVFGILPVAVLGLGWFVAMTLLNLPWAWRSADERIRAVRLGLSVVGMGFVLYLIYAELFQINAICLWCSVVHVLTFALFVLLVFDASRQTAR